MYSSTMFGIFGLIVLASFAHALSTKEEKALEEFRPLVEASLTQDYMKEDAFLLPYLRARDLDVKRAQEMLEATMRWRKEHNIDNLLEESLPVEKALPYNLEAVDREKNPVGVLKFGLWDARRLVLAGKTNEGIKALYKILEKAMAKAREMQKISGNEVTQITLIGDAGGYTLRKHGCLACLRIYVELFIALESHYPGAFKHIVVINAPRLFDGFVELAKPVMTKTTRESLEIYGYNKEDWSQALLKIISRDQLEIALERTL